MNKVFLSFIACFAIISVAMGVVLMDTDSSDADSASETWEVGKHVGDTTLYNTTGMYIEWSGSVPGMNIRVDFQGGMLPITDKRWLRISGTPTTPGNYTIDIHSWDSLGKNNYHTMYISIYSVTQYVKVTYSATPGTVNGASTWSEDIVKGTNASLPTPSLTDGSKYFRGWSTSTTGSVLSSYKAESNVTLYALYGTNSVSVSGYSATVSQGQSFSHTFSTSPSNATLSITSYGGLDASQIKISGKTISGTITADPGTYNVSVRASSGSYSSTTVIVKITVPVVIVPPIEYSVAQGDTWSYEPVTNPTNATITITSVKLNGVTYANHGLTVQGRLITGIMKDIGTVAVTFSASGSGYTSVSKTVNIIVSERSVISNPASIDSINVVPRANEPRTYDAVALGVAYSSNIRWFINDIEFASSHNTAVYEVMGPGFYEFKATVYGSNGSTDSATKTVVITETYYPDMAWVGVPYTFIKEGTTNANLGSGSFLSSQVKTSDGKSYVVISGTPSQSHVGNTYDITIGSDTLRVTVYEAHMEAPDASFELEIVLDDEGNETNKVRVTFTGSNASIVRFDFSMGLGWGTDTEFEYDDGVYTIRCLAVNNISDRITSQYVIIGTVDSILIDLSNMSDISVFVGDPVVLEIFLSEGDALTISGSATSFLTVKDNEIRGVPTEAGSYSLTIQIVHADSTSTTGALFVIVSQKPESRITVSFLGVLTNETMKVEKMTAVSVKLTVKDGQSLPASKDDITVKIGDVEYADFVYSVDTGDLYIPPGVVIADITISYGETNEINIMWIVGGLILIIFLIMGLVLYFDSTKAKKYARSKRKK